MQSTDRATTSTDTLPRRIPGASGHTPDRTDADRASYVRIPSAPGGSFYGIEQGTYTRTGTGYEALGADRAFSENAD